MPLRDSASLARPVTFAVIVITVVVAVTLAASGAPVSGGGTIGGGLDRAVHRAVGGTVGAVRPAVPSGVAAGGAQDAGRPAADALAQRIQARYQGIQDFTADFSHTYEGGVLRRKSTERGTVLIKKPGKMRWTYTTPEEKVFVSDGVKIYAYVPADRQVTVSTMPADDRASTPILFLVGKGDLTRDFVVSDATAGPKDPAVGAFPADTYALKLVPHTKVPEYEWLILVVDRASLQLRALATRDAPGGTSTFTFTHLKENVKIPDGRFTFTIPRGADVIAQS